MKIIIRLFKNADIPFFNGLIDEAFPGKDLLFCSLKDNAKWVNDINSNPKSPQAHLSPITLERLTSSFPSHTDVGASHIVIGFNDSDMMEDLISFIETHKSSFSEVQGIHQLIDQFIKPEIYEHLLYKDRYFPESSEQYPEGHPSRVVTHTGGCAAYINGTGISSIGVLYGAVTEPVMMKETRYINPDDNGLLVDVEGRSILLVPLVPADETAHKHIINTYNTLRGMYIQEKFASFIAKVYPNTVEPSDEYEPTLEEGHDIFHIFYNRIKTYSLLKRHYDIDDVVTKLSKKRFSNAGLSTKASALANSLSTRDNYISDMFWLAYSIGAMRINGNSSSDVTSLTQ